MSRKLVRDKKDSLMMIVNINSLLQDKQDTKIVNGVVNVLKILN